MHISSANDESLDNTAAKPLESDNENSKPQNNDYSDHVHTNDTAAQGDSSKDTTKQEPLACPNILEIDEKSDINAISGAAAQNESNSMPP